MSRRFGSVALVAAALIVLGVSTVEAKGPKKNEAGYELVYAPPVAPPADSVADKVTVMPVGEALPAVDKEWRRKEDRGGMGAPETAFELVTKDGNGKPLARAEWWVMVKNTSANTEAYAVHFHWKGSYTQWMAEPPVDIVLDPGESKMVRGGRTFSVAIGTPHGKHLEVQPKGGSISSKDAQWTGPGIVGKVRQVGVNGDKVKLAVEVPIAVTKHTITAYCKGFSTTKVLPESPAMKMRLFVMDWNYQEIGRAEKWFDAKLGEAMDVTCEVEVPKAKLEAAKADLTAKDGSVVGMETRLIFKVILQTKEAAEKAPETPVGMSTQVEAAPKPAISR
jgi:hypothetical protein